MAGRHIGLECVAGTTKKSVSTMCQYTVSWSSRLPDDSITLCAVRQNLNYDPNSLYECVGSGTTKGHLPEKYPTLQPAAGLAYRSVGLDPGNELTLLNWWLVLLTPSPAATYIEAALMPSCAARGVVVPLLPAHNDKTDPSLSTRKCLTAFRTIWLETFVPMPHRSFSSPCCLSRPSAEKTQ